MSHRRLRRRRIVGVMIDGDVVRGVELRRGLRGLRVRSVAEVVVPAGTREQGRIVDTAGMSAVLKSLWKAGRFGTKRVAFGVSGRDATIRPMSVPPAAADDVDGFVRYELGDYLSYELDDAVIDHRTVGAEPEADDEPGAAEILTVGVRTALVEDIAAVVAGAGLRLESIDAAPTALAAAIAPLHDDHDGEAVVSVDGTRTTVVLRTGDQPRMVRVLAEGGGDHSTQLADELEGLIARVDQHRHGNAGEASPTGQSQRFSEAAEAVTAAIRYDIREHTGSGVSRVVLTGTFGEYDELHRIMESASGVAVSAAPTPKWWASEDDFDHFVEPAGLAFAAIGCDGARFDLQAPSVVEGRTYRRERLIGIGVAIAIVVGSIPFVEQSRDGADALEAQAVALEADVEELRSRTDLLAPVGELDDVLSRHSLAVDQAVADDLWWARILEEIAAATPDDTFLTSMSLVRPVGTDLAEGEGAPLTETVTNFTGIGSDQAAVGRWLAAMAELDVFEDVWLVQSTATVHGEAGTPVVTFLAQARLTAEARTPRAVAGASLLLGDGMEVTP